MRAREAAALDVREREREGEQGGPLRHTGSPCNPSSAVDSAACTDLLCGQAGGGHRRRLSSRIRKGEGHGYRIRTGANRASSHTPAKRGARKLLAGAVAGVTLAGAMLLGGGKGLRSQVGTMYGTLKKGPRYLEMAEGYVTGIALDADDEIIGYQFVSLGKMTDFIKKGDDPNTAWEKAKGQYGRVADAVKIIDPRKE